MSEPYVYTPHTTIMSTPYHDPYYSQTQVSPFIPSSSLYPSSPYSSATNDLPGTPNTPRRVRFGDEWDVNYDFPPRPRRPSWHGAPGSPFMSPFPSSPAFLSPEPQPSNYYRRHSFGNTGQAPLWQTSVWPPYTNPATFSPWSPVYPAQQPQFQIHPWLNGESQRPDFLFDLSSPNFNPLRLIGPGQSIPISREDLMQPATHPPIRRLRIICDTIKQWPIDLEYNPYQDGQRLNIPAHAAPPITLCDVLVALHRSLHQRISNVDWAKLSMSEETAVARAYQRRCRKSGPMEMVERGQGVKRVDFLLERVWFKGLVRAGDGWESMKLITG